MEVYCGKKVLLHLARESNFADLSELNCELGLASQMSMIKGAEVIVDASSRLGSLPSAPYLGLVLTENVQGRAILMRDTTLLGREMLVVYRAKQALPWQGSTQIDSPAGWKKLFYAVNFHTDIHQPLGRL